MVAAALALRSSGGDAGGPPAESCQQADAQLAALWNGETRARLREAFDQSGSEAAGHAFAGLVAAVDRYADAWTRAYRDSCEATYVRGEQSHEDLYLRMSCLMDQRVRIQSLVTAYAEPDRNAVEHARAAAGSLPSLDRCADVAALRTRVATPVPSAVRDQVRALRRDLAEVASLPHAMAVKQAHEKAVAAVARAREIDYPPVLAEALYWRGHVEYVAQQVDPARAAFQEAITLADEHDLDAVRARSLVDLVGAAGEYSAQGAEFDHLVRRAGAAVRRYRDYDGLADVLEIHIALAHRTNGDYRQAATMLADLAARHRDDADTQPVRLSRILTELGEVSMALGEFESASRAFREVLDIRRPTLGDRHSDVVITWFKLALAARALGDYDGARAHQERIAWFWPTERARELLQLFAGPLLSPDSPTRDIELRVVDREGTAVAGAEVMAGSKLTMDGKYIAGLDPISEIRHNTVRAKTDGDGRATLRGVRADVESVIVAENSARGRSFPIRVAPGSAGPIELRLRPYGRLRGRVTVVGPRPWTILIGLGPAGWRNTRLALVEAYARPDGTYAVARLAAGDYRIAITVTGDSGEKVHIQNISIPPGTAAVRDVTIETGGVTLEVAVRDELGGSVQSGELDLFSGRHSASNVRDLERIFAYTREVIFRSIEHHNARAELADVLPGLHTLCVLGIADDIQNPVLRHRAVRQRYRLPVHCRPLRVEPEPARQSIELVIPPVARLSAIEHLPESRGE